MRIVRHIAAKDLQRLRWGIVLWLILGAVRVFVASARSDVALLGFAQRSAADTVGAFLAFGDLVLFSLLLSSLVHEDPVVGLDRFWMTRPISWTTLLSAKTAFALVFFVMAAVLVQFMTLMAVLGSPFDASTNMATAVATEVLWALLLVAFAAGTPTLGRFIATLVGAALVLVIGLTLFETMLFLNAQTNGYRDTELSDSTGLTVGAMLLAIILCVVIVEQYRTRRPARALLIGVIGFGAAFLIVQVWPWRFGMPPEPVIAWAEGPSAVTATVDAGVAPEVSDMSPFDSRDERWLALPIRMSGLPPQFVMTETSVRSTLHLENGRTIESARSGTIGVRRPDATTHSSYTEMLQAAVEPMHLLLSPAATGFEEWPVVLSVNNEEYQRDGATPGRLTMDVRKFVHQTRVIATVPFSEGASVRTPGTRFDVRRIVKIGDGYSVLIRKTSTRGDPRRIPRGYRFVLQNSSRSEAMSGREEPLGEEGLAVSNLAFGLLTAMTRQMSALPFSDVLVHYPETNTPAVDSGWFVNAELAVIEHIYAGSITRTITVDGFRMKP